MVHLYPHQREALGKMHNGSVLCGSVGTGKSRTALAYFFTKECGGSLNTLERKETTKLIIITTAQKRDNGEWKEEADVFNLKPEIDSWNNIKKYVDECGAFFIFDEQRVVGSGVWVKSFLKIAKKNRWILLTATPGDTWMDYVPIFMANGFYRTRYDFTQQHVIWDRWSKFPKVSNYYNEGLLVRHRRDILVQMPFMKHTIPEHIYVYLPYDEEKSKRTIRDRINPFTDEPIKDAGELCRCLRQIANEDPSRIEEIKKILKEKNCAIIFYNFDYELDALRTLPVPVAEWNGHKHEHIPEGAVWAYLVQYNAGSEGWNCTKTDTIIFCSQSYSYKQMVQAAGRIDRMNTPYTKLYYYHLTSRSKIDLAISKALRAKKNFNEKDFAGF